MMLLLEKDKTRREWLMKTRASSPPRDSSKWTYTPSSPVRRLAAAAAAASSTRTGKALHYHSTMHMRSE